MPIIYKFIANAPFQFVPISLIFILEILQLNIHSDDKHAPKQTHYTLKYIATNFLCVARCQPYSFFH